jgi:hypothetical protein
MSVVDRKFEPMKEVSTMTAHVLNSGAMNSPAMNSAAMSSHSHRAASIIAARPASDILIEKVALSLLAWSDRRAQKSRITHERMTLLLENQRIANRNGSSLGH